MRVIVATGKGLDTVVAKGKAALVRYLEEDGGEVCFISWSEFPGYGRIEWYDRDANTRFAYDLEWVEVQQ